MGGAIMSVDLKDFISKTLQDIVGGIVEAQSAEGVGSYIAPSMIGSHTFAPESGVANNSRYTSTVAKFDVAISAEAGSAAGVQAGFRVVVFSAGANAQLQERSSTVSRIQFSVPVLMPPNRQPRT